MDDLPENAILIASDRYGIYIPQRFAETVDREQADLGGMPQDDLTECLQIVESGPDAHGYWDAWDDLLCRLTVTDKATGATYCLWQDGDLWLLPIE